MTMKRFLVKVFFVFIMTCSCGVILTASPDMMLKVEEKTLWYTGRIKWFNDEKGVGCIARDDGNGDVIVHFQNIEIQGFQTLSEGDQVEFQIMMTAKGPEATHVRLIT